MTEQYAARPSRSPALSFATVADAYDRARPGYPREAAVWLTGRAPLTVIELGAGTGKLSEQLVALGHDVLATEPLEEMLAHLRLRLPQCRTAPAAAESIPAPSRSADVVVAAQAFHWFDLDRALPEIARVLRPEGRLTLAWNTLDERVPWVRRLVGLITSGEQCPDPSDDLVASRLFGYVEEASFRFWQPVRREGLRDLALSRSNVAVLEPPARDRLLRKVDDLFSDYDRGPDGLLMPYITRCYSAVVRPRPAPVADPGSEPARQPDDGPAAEAATGPPDDAGPTLIDFR